MAGEQEKILRDLAATTSVMQFLSHRDYMTSLYKLAKNSVTSYSYLKFAEELGFGLTNLMRLVLVGKRPLTTKGAEKIAKALDLHGPERRYWTALVKYGNARLPAERDQLFQLLMSYKTRAQPTELDPLQAEYFGEWYHPVIREMTGLPDFVAEPAWIQERLMFPLRLDQIKRSLQLLAKLQVVHHDPVSGAYKRSVERITTEAEVDSIALVRYHQKMLEMGSQSITAVDENLRDIRAVTVTLPLSAVALLKGKIEELVLAVAAMEDMEALAKGDQAQVVQVNVQMFPFTKSGR